MYGDVKSGEIPRGMIGAQQMVGGDDPEFTRLYQLYIIIALINTLTLYLKDRA